MNIRMFAFNLARMNSKAREATLPYHKAYAPATPEQQSDLRREWMIGYIAGTLTVSEEAAERILSAGKGGKARKAHVQAIDRASSDFRYHVIRPDGKKPETKRTRISAEHRAAAMDFLSTFEGDTLEAQIKAAMAVLKAMA